MSNFHKLGDILTELFSKHTTVTSQNGDCCTLRSTLNAWGPYLAKRHITSIIQVIRYTPEYKQFADRNPNRSINRLLFLFVKKAIKKSLLDTKATTSYTLSTPIQKEPDDATTTRESQSNNLEEHSTGNEIRQTTEASHSDSNEQSRNVKKDFRRKSKKR